MCLRTPGPLAQAGIGSRRWRSRCRLRKVIAGTSAVGALDVHCCNGNRTTDPSSNAASVRAAGPPNTSLGQRPRFPTIPHPIEGPTARSISPLVRRDLVQRVAVDRAAEGAFGGDGSVFGVLQGGQLFVGEALEHFEQAASAATAAVADGAFVEGFPVEAFEQGF